MSTDGVVDASHEGNPEAIAERLGDTIADTDAYRRFDEARTEVQQSETAQERIATFEERREAYVLAERAGEADEAAREAVEAAQTELHSLPVMQRYLDAQEALRERLGAVNDAISDPLSVDFADEAGSCCHDE